MDSKSFIADAREHFKKLLERRSQILAEVPAATIAPLDTAGALEGAAGTAQALTKAIASTGSWAEITNIVKDHDIVRSVVNHVAMKDALLDRRGKFVASSNQALRMRSEGGLIDNTLRSRT